jgi:predicted nucleic acid-binding protein
MVLVDSSVWIDHFNARATGQVAWLRRVLADQSEALAIGDYILLEILQGFRLQHHFRSAFDALSGLPCFDLGGRARCIAAAENYRKLRVRGITVRSGIDVLIATFCIDEDVSLLHNDRDFDQLERHLALKVVGV